MNFQHIYDMIIIGGGPGGYTAALYAARAGLDTVVLEKLSVGGQMALTEQIDNYPGFEDGIDGSELAEKMQRQAERFGARTEYAEVYKLDLTAQPKIAETSEGTFYGKTVILATGANPRELGVAREKELVGRGIAYCAACDGMFYKQKKVAVLAYEAGAWKEALYLSELCSEVLYFKCHDEPVPESTPSNLTVIEEKPEAVEGTLKAEILVAGGREYEVDGLFVLREAVAADSLVPGLKTEDGHVFVDRHMKTNIPGCFACGDVAGTPYQYIKAAGEGNVAALSAVSYLADLINTD